MTEPAPNTRDKSTDITEHSRSCAWRLVSIVAWLCLLLILAIFGFRLWFQSTLDPHRKAAMEKIDSEIITLPPDWQTAAKVPSADVLKFHERFYIDIELLSAKYDSIMSSTSRTTTDTLLMKLRRNDTLTSAEQTELDAFMHDFRPLATLTSAGVSLPDYTADTYMYLSSTNYFSMPNFARGASAMALELGRKGNYREALQMAVLPMRYMRHSPRSIMILHIMAIGVTHISANALTALAEHCDDSAALRSCLKDLDDVYDVAHIKNLDILTYGEWAAPLATAKAAGYPIDLSPQPMAGYIQQLTDVIGQPYNEWIVNNLPGSDMRVPVSRRNLNSLKTHYATLSWDERLFRTTTERFGDLAPIVFGFSTAALTYDPPNYLAASYRAKVAAVRFDLARLRLAQRLAELETGAVAPIGAEAVRPYIGSIPQDPFSTATVGTASQLRFSPALNQFYSVGPDEDDDGTKSLYEPANGTVSNGDIFLKL